MKKDRLGIVILNQNTDRIEEYLSYYVSCLYQIADEVIVAGSEELLQNEKKLLKKLCSYQIQVPHDVDKSVAYVLGKLEERMWEYHTLILTDESVFGPFYNLTEMFAIMDAQNYDFWGALKHSPQAGTGEERIDAYLDPSFLVFNKKMLESTKILSFLAENELSSLLQLGAAGYKAGAYCDMDQYDFPKGQNNSCYPYYYNDLMIKEQRYPFLKCDSFAYVKGIDYSHRENLKRAFSYIQSNLDYDEGLIWKYILKKYNISDIKESLQLYYILDKSFEGESPILRQKRCAVILHLYYGDLLDETLKYVKNIPADIDVYITSNGKEQIEYISKKMIEFGRKNYKVLEAGIRGRDAGALLVVCRQYVSNYDYICFVHDKKTSGGRGPRMVGDTFRNLVFENTLSSTGFINNVLDVFEKNKYLGFLSPVCPASEGYLGYFGGLGKEWTTCFPKTKELADELGLKVSLCEEKQPFALSNAFWCRTAALKKLFEKEWKFDEFDEEPLAEDGTLNHAIERIYPYVAQDAGYVSGLLLEREFASSYISNLVYDLAKHLNLIRDNLNFNISRDIETSVIQIGQEHAKWLEDVKQKKLLLVENDKKAEYIEELKLEIEEQKRQKEYEYGQKQLYIEEGAKKAEYIEELKLEIEEWKRQKEYEFGQKQLYVEENTKKEKYIDELTQGWNQERSRNEELEKIIQSCQSMSEKMREEHCKVLILKEALQHRKMYIYGAGKLAKRTVDILNQLNLDFEGFIVTEQTEPELLNHKVYQLDKTGLEMQNATILVALNAKNRQEVLPVLEELQYRYVCPWT